MSKFVQRSVNVNVKKNPAVIKTLLNAPCHLQSGSRMLEQPAQKNVQKKLKRH